MTRGVDIECHTVSHHDLRHALKGQEYNAWLHNEIYTSKDILEQKLGIISSRLRSPTEHTTKWFVRWRWRRVEPNSVEMRISGFGPVPVKYDPQTKLVFYEFTHNLVPKTYTVILSAKVKGRKMETRWNFMVDPSGAGGG